MLLAIARFEFRYLLRNPLLWVTAALTFVALAASTSVAGFELGSEGGLLRNATYATLRNSLMLSLLFMVVTTAFVSNAVVRDDETGFGPIVRTTPITKVDYLVGRFLGSIAVVALCLLLAPIGMWFGSLMPWADPAVLGPNRLGDYAFGYFVFALPNLVTGAALLFALATITRSTMGSYLGVIGFTSVFFFLDSAYGDRPQLQTALALGDPFGARVLSDLTRYWTIAERNTQLPPFAGTILANRLIWLGVAVICLGLVCWRYRFADRGMTARERKQQKLAARSDAMSAPPTLATTAVALPAPRLDGAAMRALLWMRTRFEAWQVVSSPAFPVLMAWGMLTTLISLTTQRDPDGRPSYPTTLSLIPELESGLEVVPLLVALYFAGELVWRERDRRMHEIVDATPLPSWAYVVPKTLAMALVLVSMMLIAVIAAVGVQLSLGYTALELEKYLLWYVLPTAWDMLLLAALAVFVHALSPHKVVGWGILLLFMIWQEFNPIIEHNLLEFGGKPPVPLSDLNGAGSFWIGAWTFRAYWGAFALLLLVVAHLFWRRGVDVRFRPRLMRAGRALRGTPGIVATLASLAFVTTGAVAYHNTNTLNGYRSSEAVEAEMVDFERQYAKYLTLPQPATTHYHANVALYPSERRAEVSGRYRLRNMTTQPLTDVHVRTPDRDFHITQESIAGAKRVHDDTVHGYRIYRFDTPMAPGEERELTFAGQRWIRGFRNGMPERRLVENGTFIGSEELGPVVGTSRFGMVNDPEMRAKHGLPPVKGLPSADDTVALRQASNGRGWGTSDITVSTSADQTPLAPGTKLSDTTSNGRRTAHFVSTTPLRARFAVLSARYAEKHRTYRGIDFAVYYHPAHGWNVDRMLDAMTASLDYYQANFGPYQFDHFRVAEFPGYFGFAQAFGGTIPYSEAVGFTSDFKSPETIDHVTGMTAHEFAHQWWAYQLAAAEMEGEGVLSETLAQYSAHMMIKHVRGEDQIRRYLQYELDEYLNFRSERDAPLARTLGEHHLLYRKGALVMYLLQKRLGEDAINRALRSLLARYKFKDAPYATARDLVAALRAEARSEEDQALITDLFERVTLYDLRVDKPTATQRADGKWDVRVPVVAKKIYVDSLGGEKEAPLDERIEVGLFTAEPGLDAFDSTKVVMFERRPIKAGRQVITFVSDKRPTFAGVDPYNFYIDRRSRDNVAAVPK